MISSGHGVKRFCLNEIGDDGRGCGPVSHARAKADIKLGAWYVTVAIRSHGRAELQDKFLFQSEVLPQDEVIFDTQDHDVLEWSSLFQKARVAKLSGGTSVVTQIAEGRVGGGNLKDYVKTPGKRACEGEDEEDFEDSPSWVDMEPSNFGFDAMH